MNILKWIFNKQEYETKYRWLKSDLKKTEEKVKEMEKWNKGYLDHIGWLEEEVRRKEENNKQITEDIRENKIIKANKDFYGFLNFEFHTETPTEFIHDFSEYLMQKTEEYNRNIKIIGYDYQPALITANIFSRNFGRKSKYDEEEWELEWLIHQIDHNLETIHMYGDEQQLRSYIFKLKQLNKELEEYSRKILK